MLINGSSMRTVSPMSSHGVCSYAAAQGLVDVRVTDNGHCTPVDNGCIELVSADSGHGGSRCVTIWLYVAVDGHMRQQLLFAGGIHCLPTSPLQHLEK